MEWSFLLGDYWEDHFYGEMGEFFVLTIRIDNKNGGGWYGLRESHEALWDWLKIIQMY